jgi:hypothetical protein
MNESVAVAAIVRDEDRFIDEWIIYHHLLGVTEFVLYDDDPKQNLQLLLEKHGALVKVIDWTAGYRSFAGRNRQTGAYQHSLSETSSEWVAFIDIDEFIVLRQHDRLPTFLFDFAGASSVVLTWHMFGHSGFYDPPSLVTQCLLKRQTMPGRMMKSIVRRDQVLKVNSAHGCSMKCPGGARDANNRRYSDEFYPGKTDVAHINHYVCRSFTQWMNRVKRGEVAYSASDYPPLHAWRYEEAECLRKFVEIAAQYNEIVDNYMLKYGDQIQTCLNALHL